MVLGSPCVVLASSQGVLQQHAGFSHCILINGAGGAAAVSQLLWLTGVSLI